MTNNMFRLAGVLLSLSSLAHADLFVSSNNNSIVIQYNGQTGAPVGTFASGGGLTNPHGITFGPDGNLYVASFTTDSVIKYNGQTGAFIATFVPPGSGGLSAPEGITFGSDGNLYVASTNSNSVIEYNGQTGALIGTFVPFGSGGLARPAGITFGPDGNLYVASGLTASVIKYNGQTGALIGTFASGGGLLFPLGITFGPDGNLYVASNASSTVIEYNGQTGALIGTFVPAGSGGLTGPFGITFGPDGNLYVADNSQNDVIKYNGQTGALIATFVPAGSGGLSGPTFLVFYPPAGTFQIKYVSNLNMADSVINITNTGASSNGTIQQGPPNSQININGSICVNIYAFAADEQEVACCSCLVTPNGLYSASVKTALLNSTLTASFPNEVVIKLISTIPSVGTGGVQTCNPATAGTSGALASGLLAWGTTVHGVPTATGPVFSIAETPFSQATLSAAELARDVQECQFIQILGSGQFGMCKGCSNAGLGAAAQ